MELTFNKRGHKIMVRDNDKVISMVSWIEGKVGGITGVRADILKDKRQAQIELRKMSRVLESNGYKLSEEQYG